MTTQTSCRHSFLRGLAATLAAGAFLLAFTAQAATELTVWHAYRGAEKAAFEKVVAQFNARQKDIAVRTLAVPYDAYADKITASVPRGTTTGAPGLRTRAMAFASRWWPGSSVIRIRSAGFAAARSPWLHGSTWTTMPACSNCTLE